jgi:hypothetical protein
MLITFPEQTCDIIFLNKKKSINQNLTTRYYAVKGNTLTHAMGGFNGKLLHGKFKSYYYKSKQPKCRGKFRKGKKIGKWISWYENGEIMSNQKFRNGRLNGVTKYYSDQGLLSASMKYKKGLRHGDSITYVNDSVITLSFKKGRINYPEDTQIKDSISTDLKLSRPFDKNAKKKERHEKQQKPYKKKKKPKDKNDKSKIKDRIKPKKERDAEHKPNRNSET